MTAFDALRHDDESVAPDRRFARQLRVRIVDALTPELPEIELPEIELPERTNTVPDITHATTTGADPATDSVGASHNTLTPYICVHDAAAAIDWYRLVFGANELVRYVGDDGRIGHCELDLGGVTLMLADEYPDFGAVSPRTIGGTPVTLNLQVPDVDAVWERALANGAAGQRPPETQPYGHRSSTFGDPFGHRWMVQTEVSTPTDAEIEAGLGGAFEVVTPASTGDGSSGPAGAPVEIGYVTMPFDDTTRARAFYGALFGWVTEDGHAGDRYAHIANTKLPMGMTPDGVAAPVQLYFRVDDADTMAARAVELGGRVVERSGYESGISIECVDDQGRPFIIWQSAPGY
jgi:uncharacterized glyoxalase superfamily protein PhnB